MNRCLIDCRLHLAALHPRLFHSVILIEPILQTFHPRGPSSALFSSLRREKWESRAKAEGQISKNPFFASMDPRALKLFLTYALRDSSDGGVTLSTPKAQEAWTYIRPMFYPISENTPEGRQHERMLNPEVIPFSAESKLVTMRGEFMAICEELPHVRPRALYIYGERSHINGKESQELHLGMTGTGRGGNGGVSEGGVESELVKGCGHLSCLEKPAIIAERISQWLGPEILRWKKETTFWNTVDTGKSKNGRKELSERWLAAVKQDTSVERPGADKSKL